jgi:hypothetical protein
VEDARPFEQLALAAAEAPVPVVELLRAWRAEGRDDHDPVAATMLAGSETSTRPTDRWLGCLRALEDAFAPDELGHLTAMWARSAQAPRVATTQSELRERLERVAARAGFLAAPDPR